MCPPCVRAASLSGGPLPMRGCHGCRVTEHPQGPQPSSALRTTAWFAHVSTLSAVALTVGGATSCVTVTESAAEHPFAPVTLTVYVPGAFTVKAADVPMFLPAAFVQA